MSPDIDDESGTIEFDDIPDEILEEVLKELHTVFEESEEEGDFE